MSKLYPDSTKPGSHLPVKRSSAVGRRLITLTLATVIGMLSASVYSADFRNATWGMTMNEVKALHPGEIAANQKPRSVNFDGKLAGLDVLIFYNFDERGALFQAGYLANATYDDESAYITDYEKLNALLERKYPQSAKPKMTWTKRLFEDRPERWGRAVMLGHLTYEWQYNTDNTRILHQLSGDRRKLTHILSYTAVVDEGDTNVLDEL